eukprot:2406599-Pleurochrysis_carterae.AAC.3
MGLSSRGGVAGRWRVLERDAGAGVGTVSVDAGVRARQAQLAAGLQQRRNRSGPPSNLKEGRIYSIASKKGACAHTRAACTHDRHQAKRGHAVRTHACAQAARAQQACKRTA